jgi:hypothetical protein
MNRLLSNIGITLISTLVMLAIAELVVRGLYGDDVNLFPRYHTDAQYGEFTLRKIRPNSEFWHKSVDGSWKFVTNSQGFRNLVDFDYEKPADTIRVLSLGDSHTQGYEVRQEYTFSSVVARYLSRENYSVEVMNAGVSGFSTSEALLFLENEGIKYKPDFVLLGFYRNDLEDNIKSGLFKLDEDNNLYVAKNTHIPGVKIQNIIYSLPGVQWLSENSYFYSIMFNTTWVYFKKKLARTKSEATLEYATARQQVYSDYQIDLASSLLGRMHAFCSENGIKLIIIDIPSQDAQGRLTSSFPASLLPNARENSDAYVDSIALLSDYSGVGELHLPHGSKHISEFTHTVLGADAARKIMALVAEQKVTGTLN